MMVRLQKEIYLKKGKCLDKKIGLLDECIPYNAFGDISVVKKLVRETRAKINEIIKKIEK